MQKHLMIAPNVCVERLDAQAKSKQKLFFGREPWSSGYGWRLMLRRLWV